MRKLSFEEIQKLRPDLNSIKKLPRHPISALVDNVRSLHNVGSIFRTSDAVRLQHLYLCGITAKPPRDEIRKTSLGAEESVPWSYYSSALEVAEILRSQGIQLVALELTDISIDYRRADYRFPLCFIVGHEYRGISAELLAYCDLAVEIPMYGIKHSLNVSVSFGVMAYELVRRWEEQSCRMC
ncbi:MAG: RNA methyltransferase [candidate division KSB1 bacterium]|nr:RNA methyltransferase [candidate division KSB1 bacterium]MDZ7345250.1 RNA methyltransferase [candidate division KSB1 bacterium]